MGVSQVLSDSIQFENTLYGVDISKDGALIFIAGKDSTATIWDSDKQLKAILTDHSSSISSINYLDGESTILTGSYDHTAILWNLEGQKLLTLRGHSNGVIQVSQSSTLLGTASRDKTAKVWNRAGDLLLTLNHSGQVNAINFVEDRQWIVTASFDKTLKIWNEEGILVRALAGHASGIRSFVIVPERNLIIAGHRDGRISWIDLEGKLLKTISAHGLNGETYKMVNAVVRLPTGNGFMSAGADGYVRWWNMEGTMRREELIAYEKDAYVSGMAFGKATFVTVSGGKNPGLKIWKIPN